MLQQHNLFDILLWHYQIASIAIVITSNRNSIEAIYNSVDKKGTNPCLAPLQTRDTLKLTPGISSGTFMSAVLSVPVEDRV